MRNMANRHRIAAVRAGRREVTRRDYAFVDPNHPLDMGGKFAGLGVRRTGGKTVVAMSDRQARFYIDQGLIVPHGHDGEERPRPRAVAPQLESNPGFVSRIFNR